VWIFNQLKTFQRFALPPNGLPVIQRGTMHSYQDHDQGVYRQLMNSLGAEIGEVLHQTEVFMVYE
jgi:hypothetical protein